VLIILECGNKALNSDTGEECDGGTGCTSSCTCDAASKYEPTSPATVNCRKSNIVSKCANIYVVCGDDDLDSGEQCDGGTGCTSSCTCNTAAGYEPKSPLATSCQKSTIRFLSINRVQVCGNGERNTGELCDAAGVGCLPNCTCGPQYEALATGIDCQSREYQFGAI